MLAATVASDPRPAHALPCGTPEASGRGGDRDLLPCVMGSTSAVSVHLPRRLCAIQAPGSRRSAASCLIGTSLLAVTVGARREPRRYRCPIRPTPRLDRRPRWRLSSELLIPVRPIALVPGSGLSLSGRLPHPHQGEGSATTRSMVSAGSDVICPRYPRGAFAAFLSLGSNASPIASSATRNLGGVRAPETR